MSRCPKCGCEEVEFFGEGLDSEIDLDSNNVVKIGESGEKKVDVQQQLRYVAVSRATNTVSIISDNVKSEASPLNHISEEEQFEEVIEPIEQQSISNSYDEIFTPVQPVQQETITEEEVEETIEDEIEQQFEEKQKEIDKAVKEAEDFITANNSFSEQVENLINSTDVNQSEITELANEVSYYMSDLITQWQDNPKAFFENFPSKRKETEDESIKWFNSLSRKQIIVNEIIKEQAKTKGENPETIEMPYKISEKDIQEASKLSSMEQAERNKEYALYTMAILAKVYGDEVNRHTGNIVPLTDMPGVSTIVDTLRNDSNSGVKIASIDALRYLYKPEYREELEAVLKIATTDPNPLVARTAGLTIEELNQ